MSYSIIAILKRNSAADAMGTIYLRGYYQRKPIAAISTGKRVKVEHWDQQTRSVVGTAPNAAMINMVIQMQLQKMQSDLMKKEIMGTAINRAHIKKAIKNVDDSKDFYEFCRHKIADYTKPETIRTYNSEVSKLVHYQAVLSFSDIDYSFLCRYKTYMEKKLLNKPNTVWKSFKFISTMINKALKCGGIIDQDPFADFDRGKYTQGRRTWLNIEHINEIEKLTESKNDQLRKVAIYFLLMAYSGMRFSDAMLFNPCIHIQDNERIIMKYQKFGTEVNIKLYDRLKKIVELVAGTPFKTTNQNFNESLKVIAGICNIPISLSAHVGRHTMGSILADLKIPEERAQIILGHKNIKSTRIYYHMNNKNIDTEMDKFNAL